MESRIPHVYISDEQREYFRTHFDTISTEQLREKNPEAARIAAACKLYAYLEKSTAPEDVIEAADYLAEALGIPCLCLPSPI